MKKVLPRNDKAVSPVIGTVLLIAITVTLAASLYTVLGSYFSTLQGPSPTASLKVVNDTTTTGGSVSGNYTLFITYISNNVSTGNVKVMILTNNTTEYTFTLSSVESSPGGYAVYSTSLGSITADYSGTHSALTSSSSIKLTETGNAGFISRISLIDTRTDSSMGSVSIIS